jgi:hypothetical protein
MPGCPGCRVTGQPGPLPRLTAVPVGAPPPGLGIVELTGIGLIATPAAVALTRYLIVRAALRDAKPNERPAILAALLTAVPGIPPVPPPHHRHSIPAQGCPGLTGSATSPRVRRCVLSVLTVFSSWAGHEGAASVRAWPAGHAVPTGDPLRWTADRVGLPGG